MYYQFITRLCGVCISLVKWSLIFLIYIIYLKLLFWTNWLIYILKHWILPGKSITTADYVAI